MGENGPSSALPPINKESSTYSDALPENTSEPEDTEDPWTNTCWQAVRYIMAKEGQTMEGTLPEDDWVIELYLLEGGGARYREWKPRSFDYIGVYHLLLGIGPDCFWFSEYGS